jgi:hypothetical protein
LPVLHTQGRFGISAQQPLSQLRHHLGTRVRLMLVLGLCPCAASSTSAFPSEVSASLHHTTFYCHGHCRAALTTSPLTCIAPVTCHLYCITLRVSHCHVATLGLGLLHCAFHMHLCHTPSFCHTSVLRLTCRPYLSSPTAFATQPNLSSTTCLSSPPQLSTPQMHA